MPMCVSVTLSVPFPIGELPGRPLQRQPLPHPAARNRIGPGRGGDLGGVEPAGGPQLFWRPALRAFGGQRPVGEDAPQG